MITEEKKILARKLYIEQGMEAEEIANTLSEDKALVLAYIKTNEWQDLRAAKQLSPSSLIKLYYEQSDVIVQQAKAEDRALTLKEAETLNNLATAIQKIDKRLDAGVVMDVLEGFNNYLVKLKPQLTRDIIEHELNYVRQLLNKKK